MPLEIRGGDVISVPCRACGKQFLKYRVEEGAVQVSCKCGRQTQVVARREKDQWKIYTAPVAEITNRNSH